MYSNISTPKKKGNWQISVKRTLVLYRLQQAHPFLGFSLVPGTSPITVLSAARGVDHFKMAFYRKDLVQSSSEISEVNQAREGSGLVRVAAELLPALTCSPAAVGYLRGAQCTLFLLHFAKVQEICQCLLCALHKPCCMGHLEAWRQWYLI